MPRFLLIVLVLFALTATVAEGGKKPGLPKGCDLVFPKGGGWPVNGDFVPRLPGQVALVICDHDPR